MLTTVSKPLLVSITPVLMIPSLIHARPQAAPAEALSAAKQLLNARGLQPKASNYVLASEVEFSKSLSALRKVRTRLDDALEKQSNHQAQQKLRRIEMLRLLEQRQRANEQITRAKSVRRHNQLVGEINAMTDRLTLLDEALHSDTLYADINAAVGIERTAYMRYITDLRTLADTTTARYAELQADPEVAAALTTLSAGRKRPFTLGPRSGFARKLEQLTGLEGAVQTADIPLQDRAKVHWVDVRLNGTVVKPFILDTGASGISLPSAYAAEIGLVPGPDTPDYTFFVADGRSVTAKLMMLKSVTVGDFQIRDLECVVLPPDMTGAPPLLGGTFLRHFVYSVDPASNTLHLSRVTFDAK